MSWPNKDPHTGNSPQFAGVVSLHLSLVNDQVGVTLKGAIPIADTTRVLFVGGGGEGGAFLGGGEGGSSTPPPPTFSVVCFDLRHRLF